MMYNTFIKINSVILVSEAHLFEPEPQSRWPESKVNGFWTLLRVRLWKGTASQNDKFRHGENRLCLHNGKS